MAGSSFVKALRRLFSTETTVVKLTSKPSTKGTTVKSQATTAPSKPRSQTYFVAYGSPYPAVMPLLEKPKPESDIELASVASYGSNGTKKRR
jgi:hypothetical protein